MVTGKAGRINMRNNKADGLALEEVSQGLLSTLWPSLKKEIEKHFQGVSGTVSKLEINLK